MRYGQKKKTQLGKITKIIIYRRIDMLKSYEELRKIDVRKWTEKRVYWL